MLPRGFSAEEWGHDTALPGAPGREVLGRPGAGWSPSAQAAHSFLGCVCTIGCPYSNVTCPSWIVTTASSDKREPGQEVPRTLRAQCPWGSGGTLRTQGARTGVGKGIRACWGEGFPAALRPPRGLSRFTAPWLLPILACPWHQSFLCIFPSTLPGRQPHSYLTYSRHIMLTL